MMTALAGVLVASAAAVTCEKDPARSVTIVERPAATTVPAGAGNAPGSASNAANRAATPPPAAPAAKATDGVFHLAACPPLPEEGNAGSNFAVTGPCAFQQRGTVSCEALADDFIIVGTRRTRSGATVMVYINVEQYTGPGVYKRAQMFVGVQDKVNIWRWSNDNVDITVGAKEAFAEMPATRLEAEPVLVNCTGPMTDFKCEGRGDEPAFEKSIETASGRLQCEPNAAKP